MTWLGLLQAMVIAIAAFTEWLGKNRLVQGQKATQIAVQLKAVLDDIAKANAARRAVRGTLERDPERLRDDDGFKRRD